MWLPTVFGRDHEPRGDLLVREPAREQRSTSTSRGGEAGRPLAAAEGRGGRRRRARPRRRRRRAARPRPRRAARRRLLGRSRGTVRPRLAHRLVGVGRAEDPRAAARSRRPRARAGTPSRRAARGAAPRSRRAARAAGDCWSMRSVRYGCSRTRSHSPAPSGPGLSQIAFETPSRPRSCTSPARRSVTASPSAGPAARARRELATAPACPSV